jgi:hypothetical protein
MSSTPNRPLPKALPLDRGAFILSLDTEFAWGDVDLPQKTLRRRPKTRTPPYSTFINTLKKLSNPRNLRHCWRTFFPSPQKLSRREFF